MKAIKRTRKKNSIERKYCPICHSSGTIGEVITIAIDNLDRQETVYFCSKCLCEFDDRGLRIFNSNGKYVGIDESYKYIREG